MLTLDNDLSNNNNNNDIVKLATSLSSLYKYTHQRLRNIIERLRWFDGKLNIELPNILFAMQRDRIMIKLYVYFVDLTF